MGRRELAYQIVLIVLIGVVGWFVFATTQTNLARLGVDSGFDFLWKRAGFEISQSLIPFSANDPIARAFVVALLNTLVLALVSILGATVLGVLVGVSRLSGNWLLSHLAAAYVELFRNIPSLLQIFFWYFVVLRALPRSKDSLVFMDVIFLNNRGLFLPFPEIQPLAWYLLLTAVLLVFGARYLLLRRRWRYATGSVMAVLVAVFAGAVLLGIGTSWEVPAPARFGFYGGLVLMPEFMALVVGLSMYNATYVSEIVRSGFSAIPRGQREAAASLGLPPYLILRLILFPQALRIMIPPLTSVYLNLFKSTSLAAAIAYPEIVSVFVGTVNNLVGQPVIIMAVTLLIYALVSLSIAFFLNWYNRYLLQTTM